LVVLCADLLVGRMVVELIYYPFPKGSLKILRLIFFP